MMNGSRSVLFYQYSHTTGAVGVVSTHFYAQIMSLADFKDYKQFPLGLAMTAHMDTMGKGP